MPIPSNILQSLISINRQSIHDTHKHIDSAKCMRNYFAKSYKSTSEEYHKGLINLQKHLALLVRNQVALKKALREKYEADMWDRLTFVYEEF